MGMALNGVLTSIAAYYLMKKNKIEDDANGTEPLRETDVDSE